MKKKKREVCLATRHQNKIDKLLKIINSEEFYDWDDREITRLTKIITNLMGLKWQIRDEYLEDFFIIDEHYSRM
jgi:hypothetical protein